MADQPITSLPIKTASGMAATDYLLGIGSTEEYQMLIQDLGDYIIQNALSSLAGQSQTIADAFTTMNNALTMVAKYDGAATFSSKETLSTVLDGLLNTQESYRIGCYRLTCTAAFDSFSSGYDYCAQLTRAGSINYCIAELTPIDDGLVKILGKRKSTGWTFEVAPSRDEITALHSKITDKGAWYVLLGSKAENGNYTLNASYAEYKSVVVMLFGSGNSIASCIYPTTMLITAGYHPIVEVGSNKVEIEFTSATSVTVSGLSGSVRIYGIR